MGEDGGSPLASKEAFGRRLKEAGLLPSMGYLWLTLTTTLWPRASSLP